MDYFGKVKKFLFEPTKAFDKEKKTSGDDAFKYLVVLSVVAAVITAIIAGVAVSFVALFVPPGSIPGLPFTTGTISGVMIVAAFFITLVGVVIGSIISSLWLHIWLYLLGAKKGIDQTFKAVFYGQTPVYLLFWIPWINIIVALWGIVLVGMGLKRLHRITTGKVVTAMIISLIIPFIIALVIAGTALLAYGPAFYPPGV